MCFVSIAPNRHKYTVYSNGVHIYNDHVSFMHDYKVRFTYDDLYIAIQQFNYLVKRIIESLDWYKDTHFLEDFQKVRLSEL